VRRRLLNLLAILSALLCVIVVVLWVRSYLPEQFHPRSYKGRILLIFAAKQHVHLFSSDDRNYPLDETIRQIYSYTSGDPGAVQFGFAGFEVALSDREYGFWFFAVPHWAIAVPLAAAAGWGWWAGRRRSRREKAGRCLRCGYDLRASGERCPECGTPAPQSAESAE
jgi:hypothetical protein